MKPTKFVNPLFDALRESENVSTASSGDQVATAAIYNERVGECPKCKQPMTTATIANGDTVFFCKTDRVSTPMADPT